MPDRRDRDIQDQADRMRLRRRFNELADQLPGEGFPDDEITDAMIRALCHRIGNRADLIERVRRIADIWWFDERPRS
jgi:hypothetical protein